MDIDLNLWFFLGLGVWLGTSFVRNVYEARKYRKTNQEKVQTTRIPHGSPNKKSFRAIMVVMFVMWAAWAFMAFSDPVRFTSVGWLRWVGAGLFALGIAGFVLSEIHRGKGEGFTTSGIYSVFRHPMYVAQVLMAAGVALFGRGLVTLCLVLVWIVQVVFWAVAEERVLIQKNPEYTEYRKRTFF